MKKVAFALLEATAFLTRPFWTVFFLAITFLPLSANTVGRTNLRTQLGVKGSAARRILARVHQQYACYFLELVVLWPLGLLRTRGADAFGDVVQAIRARYALRDDQGIVCLGAHYGNIEALGDVMRTQFAARGLKPFCVLAKPSRYRWANALMELVRQKRGFLVLWTGGPHFAQEFDALVRSGNGIALLADQKPKKGGVFVRFFEQEAAFPDKGVNLALAQGMAFVHVTARRLGLGHFEMICEEGCNAHHASGRATATEVLTAYARWLEGVVRKEPGQWSWDYRKWSRKNTALQASTHGASVDTPANTPAPLSGETPSTFPSRESLRSPSPSSP